MSTIAQLLQDNTDNIGGKTSPNSITPTIDAAEREKVINELLARGIKIVADTTSLSSVSGADFKQVVVEGNGIYKWLNSGSANGTTIFSASGGGTWNQVFSSSSLSSLSVSALSLTVDSATQITSNWTAVNNAFNYILQRATQADYSDAITIYSGQLLTFASTGLTAATQYYFRVKAQGFSYLDSAYDTDNATTSSLPTLSTPTLTATAISDTQINVAIGSVTNGVTYKIEWSATGTGGWTEIYSGAAGTYNHTGLTASTAYYYRGHVEASGYTNSGYATANATTTSASLLTANRIAEYFFEEGSGQTAFNEVGGNTSDNNLIHPSERAWTGISNFVPNVFVKSYGTSATLTTNFAANVNGKVQACRLQTEAGADEYSGAYRGIRVQGYTFSAGTYTLSLAVKSNTGSVQTMRMSCGGASLMSGDLNVTTEWTRVSYTFAHPGGSPLLYFAINGSAGTALDILFDELKLESGSSATAYVTPKLDFKFGTTGYSTTDDPTWVTEGVNVASEAQYAFAYTDTPVTVTNISAHLVAKVDPASTNQNILFGTVYGDGGFEIMVGKGGNGDPNYLPKFKFRNQQAVTDLSNFADGLWHHYAGTYDGTTLKLYVDSVLMASFNATLTSFNIDKLLLNHTPLVGGVGGNARIAYAGLFSAAHSESEVDQQYTALKAKLTSERSITMADLDNVVAVEGDSISIDVNNFNKLAFGYMSTPCIAENFATVGAQISTLISRKASVKAWLNQTKFAGKNKILSLFVGANDMVAEGRDIPAWIASVKAYCLEMKTDVSGLKILIHTILPNTGSAFVNTNRAIANPAIVSDSTYYDGIVRFDLVSGMGADGDELNTTNYSDGIHPTLTGHGLLRSSHQTGLESLLV